MSKRKLYIIVGALLVIVFLLAFFSIRQDTFTFDETAHVGAGYSYLTQKDMRLNPEHPPLIKDLSALPLLFLNLNFPKDHSSWIQPGNPVWWLQFDFGTQFLYKAGNNPDQILLWSRMPMILILILLCLLVFCWTKKLFGDKAGLLALFLLGFSPTFLAHGRLVTTDVGAAFGVVLAAYFWLKFLKNPEKKNVILAGLIFGAVMLIKFSLILLVPFFALITIIYALIFSNKKRLSNTLKYTGLAFLAGIIGIVFIVLPAYQYHVLNYPLTQQIRDTTFLLNTSSISQPLIKLNLWLSSNKITRGLGHYLLGILLAVNRSSTGNTTYFLGEISGEGFRTYFPIIYSIKVPLAFHILTIIALLYFAWLIKKPFWKNTFKRINLWIKSHFTEFAMLVFIAIYWLTSLNSKLNIGVRHLLPVFPFVIILVSGVITMWLKPPHLKIKKIILAFLIIWQAFTVIKIYPHFLAYFNELAGGPEQGYVYAVDSNLDWGQDLKRLKNWIEEYNLCSQIKCDASLNFGCPPYCYKISAPVPEFGKSIDKIYIDYFGGGNLDYYLGKDNYIQWQNKKSPQEISKGSFFAVSVNQLQGGRAIPVKGYDQPADYYRWLDKYEPIAKIGYSIFVYHID